MQTNHYNIYSKNYENYEKNSKPSSQQQQYNLATQTSSNTHNCSSNNIRNVERSSNYNHHNHHHNHVNNNNNNSSNNCGCNNNLNSRSPPVGDFVRNPILKVYPQKSSIKSQSYSNLPAQPKTVSIVSPSPSPSPEPSIVSSSSRTSDLLKTQLKKEQLETEIEILENKAKLKRQELRHSIGQNNHHDYDLVPNRLPSTETIKTAAAMYKPTPPVSNVKSGYKYDDVVKIMNQREMLKSPTRNYYDRTKDAEQQFYDTKDELVREQKYARERVTKLETELESARTRLEDTVKEKDELHNKVTTLENKLINLQQDLSKKERENFNNAIAENTERHLTSLCQTLTSQLEDVREQLRQSEEKYKKLEAEFEGRLEKAEALKSQVETLRKENDTNIETQSKQKRNYEEQLSNMFLREKETADNTARLLKEKDDELYKLKLELVDIKNNKISKQELNDAILQDYKETICKQDQEIQTLAEALRAKQMQFDEIKREFEYSLGPKMEERLQKERANWEQDQNYIIRRELSKLSEDKNKEIAKIQEEFLLERDKSIKEREKCIQLEKELEDLKQEVKFAHKEKATAITKAKDSLRVETEKIKEEILNEKFDEINRFKRVIKELEAEIEQFKVEQYQHIERDKELLQNIEKLEKNLIKDLNDEQRRISTLAPGILPKIVNYSNLRGIYTVKNLDSILSFTTFQTAFANLKSVIDELIQQFQNVKTENETNKKSIYKLNQEKDDGIELVKRQYEKQKQKDLETIRDYISKDQNTYNSYTTEVSSLVTALKNKDKEIQDIQDNMATWKQETLEKLAEKFEIELNKELDRRMKEYKIDSTSQQLQLDRIRKEMDTLIKECRDASRNLISQEAHDRMVNYYKSRMEDFRNENITLRNRLKSSGYLHQQMNMLSASKNNINQDELQALMGSNMNSNPFSAGGSINGDIAGSNIDDDICGGLLYTPSIDGEDNLIVKNEILQQRLSELEKLQLQLNNA